MEGRDKILTDWAVETLPVAERTGLGLADAGVRLVKAGDLKLDGLVDGDVLVGVGDEPALTEEQVAEYLRSAVFPLVLTRRVESLVDGFVETYDDPIVVDRTYLETDCTEVMLDASGGVVMPKNTGTTYQRRYFIPRVGWNVGKEEGPEVEIIGSYIDGNRSSPNHYGVHYMHFTPEEHTISSIEVDSEDRRIYGRDAYMLPSHGERGRFVAVIDSRKLFRIDPESGSCLWESNLEDGGDTRYPDRIVGRGLVRDVDVIALFDRGRKRTIHQSALPPMYWLVRSDNGNRFWQGSVEQFNALAKVEYQEPMSPLPDLAGDKGFKLDLLLDEHPEITYEVTIFTSERSSTIKSIVVTRAVERRDWQVLRAEFQGQLVHAWSEPNRIHLLVYIAESRSYAHVNLAVRCAGL